MSGTFSTRVKISVAGLLVLLALVLPSSAATTRRFTFNVEYTKVTRLCHTKQLLTVNGKYPGPTIAVHEGDNVEITVNNKIETNTTLHWHGIRQMRTGWADGPAYITQCPIAAGTTYVYKFNVRHHRGTLWWHSHVFWQRASVYGALIIYPRMPYPFSAPIQAEVPIIFGEWWNMDADEVENQMMLKGGGPNASDAYTINGLPGPLYNCSQKDTFVQTVTRGKTYMLRIISAALNDEFFFAVANHTLTVVEIDAIYTKPFSTRAIMIAPGQTTTVLLTADQVADDSSATFVMAATPYVSAPGFPFDNSTTVGFLRYGAKRGQKFEVPTSDGITLPQNLPEMQDNPFVWEFSNRLKSLASAKYPCNVPQTVDKRIFSTIGLQLQDCPENKTCEAFFGKRFMASMNNQSFIRPTISLLQSYYHNLKGQYSAKFPERPPNHFDFTGVDPITQNMNTEFGTKIIVVPYGTNLEIVWQNTNFLHVENHPIHVHGHNFFVVGRGVGNYNPKTDPLKYNLVDPPERNTVAVTAGGWAAIRFKADNPGAWFIHCHFEVHTTWGLATAFIVQNGPNPSQSVLPPPRDLPSC